MITGNKGEWSEIYTLFKLLGDGKVHAGDANMQELPLYYPILNIIREESKCYHYQPNHDRKIVVVTADGIELARLSMNKFIEESHNLLSEIQKAKGNGAFSIEKTEQFMKRIGCETLKAPSTDKADIHIVIHDLRTNMTPNLGFSIKSQLGSAATLLNPGKATNIRFKVTGKIDDDVVNKINAIDEHVERIKMLYECGYVLEYDDIEHKTFKNNLLFIDSNLPHLIAECMVVCGKIRANGVKDIISEVASHNPLGYQGTNLPIYYEHKMKQLLLASALGMTPAKEWNGKFDANGGYLVVRKDGQIVCYHFYNQNDVEDYLYNNTRFDRASRTRYNYGYIYKLDSQYYLDLNLQIRFKK